MVERQFVALKVVGSSPITYPLKNYSLLKKIKRRSFKKKNLTTLNTNYIEIIAQNILINIKNIRFYKKYLMVYTTKGVCKSKNLVTSPTINISQKRFNNKATVSNVKTLNTFSVGSVIKYFKINQSKYIRRSTKGLKIFLNFLKNVFEKRYLNRKTKFIVLNIAGVDYNLIMLKKNLKRVVNQKIYKSVYLVYNIKISFTKTKDKKIKSIKKRLKKKILKNYLKKIVNL